MIILSTAATLLAIVGALKIAQSKKKVKAK
jgi:hypothetical protein